MTTFTIPGRLAGANELIAAINRHRMIGAKLKKQMTHHCAMAAMVEAVPKYLEPVRIHFHWVEPNKKRDLDNISYAKKFVCDGLREAGKIPNDGWANIIGLSDSFAVDKDYPRIEVTIT
jgi:Holliday junction resolvase RusA-like endonuclease